MSFLNLGSRIWRAVLPAGARQSLQPLIRLLVEQRMRAGLQKAPLELRPGPLIVSGLFAEAKGVSEGARLTLAGLSAAGFSPRATDLRKLLDGSDALSEQLPGGVLLIHANAPEAAHLLGRLSPGDWLGRYRIGYWAYELPRVPKNWTRIASAFHEIWAPSQFVVDALRESGVKVPIRLMPHPVALGERPQTPERASFGVPPTTFSVLVMGDLKSSSTRKNLSGSIMAYQGAFPAPGAAHLVVKVRESTAHGRAMREVRRLANGRPDIQFLTDDLSPIEVRKLIASCDVLVSLHRSEGFGLPLAEAFMAQRPALATGWSGNLEFMSEVPELLVASSLVPVKDRDGVYRDQSLAWAEPDLDDAAERLRQLANSPELRRQLAERGLHAVKALSANWTADALSDTPLFRLTKQ